MKSSRSRSRAPFRGVCLLASVGVISACSAGSPPPKSQSVAAAPTPAASTPESRGRELVERVVTSMGGAAVVDSVQSLEVHGKARRILPSGEVGMNVGMQMLYPDRYRQELELPSVKLVTVVGPEGAFTDMGDGPVLLPDPQRKDFELGFRRNLISILKARNSTGFRAVAGEPTEAGDAVEVTLPGVSIVLVLDRDSGRISRMRFTTAEGLRLSENETTYSDWRTVSGLTYPFATATVTNGKPVNTVQVETILVNPPLDLALFQPKTAPVPAESTDPEPPPAPPAPSPTKAPGV